MSFKINYRIFYNLDWFLLIITFLIVTTGILNLYSTSLSEDEDFYKQQLFWFIISLFILIITVIPSYRHYEEYAFWLYFIINILLIIVLIVGKTVFGSQRWIAIGPITFQPSEFMKIAIILVTARYFHNNKKTKVKGYTLRELIIPFIIIGFPTILILKEPDLGTGIMVMAIGTSIILFARVAWKSLVILIIFFLIAIPITYKYFLKDYQRERIETFLNPDKDPLKSGYHITQSKIAVGSGKISGKGYLKGKQAKLLFLPARHTDFVFANFAEEWGFIGSFTLLFLYWLLIMRGITIAKNAKDRFSRLVSIGATSIFLWHTLINVGMTLGIFPVVGITLPFMSYGGSSFITNFIAIGLLMNITARKYYYFDL